MDAYKPGSIGRFGDFIEDSLDMETCLKSPNTHDQVPETRRRPASGLPAEYDREVQRIRCQSPSSSSSGSILIDPFLEQISNPFLQNSQSSNTAAQLQNSSYSNEAVSTQPELQNSPPLQFTDSTRSSSRHLHSQSASLPQEEEDSDYEPRLQIDEIVQILRPNGRHLANPENQQILDNPVEDIPLYQPQKNLFSTFLDSLRSQNNQMFQQLRWKFSAISEKQHWKNELLNYISRTSDEDLCRGVSTELIGSTAADAGGVAIDIFKVAVQDFISTSEAFEGDNSRFLRNPESFWSIPAKECKEMELLGRIIFHFFLAQPVLAWPAALDPLLLLLCVQPTQASLFSSSDFESSIPILGELFNGLSTLHDTYGDKPSVPQTPLLDSFVSKLEE